MIQKRIPSAALRDLCGGVSDMTVWRWLNNPAMNFPQPIYIGRRRYWKEADVFAWLESQTTKTAA
jgi:predicted DNA-binding transcriptional regulator AlpA